ncbi:MAG: sugar transferase [Clostridia bacterium]|nr:sugar transferase [Clostridia bacterium]
MQKNGTVRSKHIDFILVDMLSIELAFITACAIWFAHLSDLSFYKKIDVVILGVYVILMLFSSFHSSIIKRGFLKELWNTILTCSEVILATLGILFVFKESATYSRMVFGMFYLLSIAYMYAGRLILKAFVRSGFKSGKNRSNVVILTYPENAVEFYKTLNKDNNGFYSFVGMVMLSESDLKDVEGIPVIPKEGIFDFVKENAVNEVYILAKGGETGKLVDQFLNMGIMVHLGLNLEVESLPNIRMEQKGPYSVITTGINKGTLAEYFIKRVFDIFASIFGLIFMGLLFLIFAPIIKIQSPGPVFFAQKRVGKNGKIFKMYKFRSMYMDAEERKKELMAQNQMKGLMFKMDNDPRIFPAGKFMRKTSIDEFPQFINILKGDMSLVGTRPPTLDEYEQYDPHHLSRLAIKPGLTGMWQVSGRSEITDFEEIVRLDNEYIRNFSLALDLKIFIKTFIAVLARKGSK